MICVKSAFAVGIHAFPVDISHCLPQFIAVGLPDVRIRERVCTATKNSGYQIPPDKITITLKLADINLYRENMGGAQPKNVIHPLAFLIRKINRV